MKEIESVLLKQKIKRNALSHLLIFDNQLSQERGTTLVGIDEVGRGCLAGPVTACAIILPPLPRISSSQTFLNEIKDSKLLNPVQREKLATGLKEIANWAVAEASVAEIDRLNILKASLLAMRRAFELLCQKLSTSYENILAVIDGRDEIPELDAPQMALVKGDNLSLSIASASIIAKVHRDQFMRDLSTSFPQYCWHENKGYGSKSHQEAILKHGLTIWHRQKFVQKLLAKPPESLF